ncbi:putative sensor histidine kinase pdtaS [Roseovarius sp. A-2]|uniref:sensor histidine kinase n=1 Tax=Roseovarius sp. A-2 TaxID=1570360 RepID=UPI0009B5451A|nr:histidine kinase dimerization/phosphoacceptor domain -containing protein [Roseovarius sp. A-2]GAW35152.1 putative sensor histidine kinase pdtaS [Roseovarius sp. A-2]
MNTRPVLPRRALKPRLATRLILVLSIAILPLGLISVYQTNKVLQERQSLSESALLQRTQQAVGESREVIRSAISSAKTLAVQLSALQSSSDTCSAVMSEVVKRSDNFTFAGYRDNARGLICASRDVSANTDSPLAALPEIDQQSEAVLMRPLEFLGGIATFSVTVPVIDEGRFVGTVWIAVPVSALNGALSQAGENVNLVLFKTDGDIIATEDYNENRRSVLPTEYSLQGLAASGRQTFRGQSREGETRDFAVAPIVSGQVFVLGSWMPQGRGIQMPILEQALALYFPFAMWAITIGVAYVGVHRLVIRHVRRLRSWMRLYASGGYDDLGDARLDDAPEELEVMADAFRAMTRRLSEQDRRREEDLQEKTVLLREVHHRVKNNLQLISSMMNMQIRATDSAEAQRLLRRVQDRVMALSAIHRYLYLAPKLSLLRADKLLEDIIQQLVIVGTLAESGQRINVTTELDQVELNPDQSVPLSLLATEAAMNAVKYCGVSADGEAWINIALKAQEDGMLCLSIVNSRATEGSDTLSEEIGSTGLGSSLIKSFATQINGTLDTQDLPERFELHVVFPIAWHEDVDEDI